MFGGRFVYFPLPLVDWEQASYRVLIGCLLFKGNDGQCPSFSCAREQAATAQHGLTQLQLVSAPFAQRAHRRAKEEACPPAPDPGVPEQLLGAQPATETRLGA